MLSLGERIAFCQALFVRPYKKATSYKYKVTIENGHKHDCWVGICGELGADLTLTQIFIQMGIDELSVSPSFVLPVRKNIRDTRING